MKTQLSIFLIVLTLIFLLSCGDDDDDDSKENCICTEPPPGVESEKTCFAQNESILAADGCNTCYCEDGGWACTEMACVDDDDNDTADDDDTTGDDDDAGPPHPYTPCCDVKPEDLTMEDPEQPAAGKGPFEFTYREETFEDTERDRSITFDLIFPSSDGTTIDDMVAPFPVVLVSHGFSSFRATVRTYGERLATWGYLAVVPQLPYTNPLQLGKISHLESTKDLLFVLNEICCAHTQPDTVFFNRIDRARLAAAGHSMGGKLSIYAAILDPALSAVVGLDPVDDSGPIPMNPIDFPSLTPELVPDLMIPTLYLGGTEGGIEVLGQACAPTDENYHQYWLYSPSPSVEITFIGGDHTDFIPPMPLDICDVGYADHNVVKALSKEYMVAFLNYSIRGWESYLDDFAGSGIDEDQTGGYIKWQEK